MTGPFDEFRDFDYEKELNEKFRDRIPDRIFDTHLHNDFIQVPPYPSRDDDPAKDPFFPEWEMRLKELMGKTVQHTGMLLPRGVSIHRPDLKTLNDENFYQCKLAAFYGYKAGILIDPSIYTYETLNDFIDECSGVGILKPYLELSCKEDKFESDIFDFAPLWMWQIAHERKIPVMLHLSHYRNQLDDPANIRQLRVISRDYPDAKIILAHCALGHNPYRLKSGLIKIRDLSNVYFDCSGVAEALSIYYVLKIFGPRRLMYGSDGYNYGIRLNRCFAFGPSFAGLHFALMRPEERGKRVFLCSSFEGLEALFAAGEIYGLDREQWEDIFHNNAVRIYE